MGASRRARPRRVPEEGSVAASREVPTPPVPAGSVDDLLFRPVRAGNAFEETVERLLQTIRLGVVGPGGRLPTEREMAARFKVSRETVREAIGALKQAGYIESHRGRYGGTFVTRALPRSRRRNVKQLAQEMGSALEDALTMRYVLEVGAAEAAARRTLTEQDRDNLQQRLKEATDVSLTDFRRHDSLLHLGIAEAVGSPSLTSAVARSGAASMSSSTRSRCWPATSSTPRNSTPRSSPRSSRATPRAPAGRWPSTWPGPPRCCAVSSSNPRLSAGAT